MSSFDVLVVGAGPAGLECARQIAKAGASVLVVERYGNFSQNDFSSACTTVESLAQLNLPQDVVGASWNKLTIVSSHVSHTWKHASALGYILDFAKLRSFLTSEIERSGGEVLMGHRFVSVRAGAGKEIETAVKNISTGETVTYRAQFVVDGTGPLRAVMGQVATLPDDLVEHVGLEYLIGVSEENDRPQEAVFLVGSRWIPHGYSWVFPMGPGRLKVGSACYSPHKGPSLPLHHHVELLIKDYLKIKNYGVLGKHGGRISYSANQRDVYVHGRIIAVGDAVSAVNPLGGEGIRHGMQSARLAAAAILKMLASESPDLSGYEREMRRHFEAKWKRSRHAAFLCYGKANDLQLDLGIQAAKMLPADKIIDILFYYNFGKGILKAMMGKAH